MKTRQYIQIYKPDVNDFTTTGDDYVPVPFKIDGSEKTHDYWDTWHLTGVKVMLFSATTNDLKVKIMGSLDGITFPQSVEAEFTVPTSAVVEKRMTTYWPYLQVQVKPAVAGQNGTLGVQAMGTTMSSDVQVTVGGLTLPPGISTSNLQEAGNAILADLATEASLSSIDDKLPALTLEGKIPVDANIGSVDVNNLPAENLGQQLSAASLSVAPATDITDPTYIGDIKFGEPLPAGTNIIGQVGIDQSTANANEVVLKSITAGPLPDTSGGDLAALGGTVDGSEIQVDVVTLAAPATLPLPTGAATEDTLSTINDKLPALTVGGKIPVDASITIDEIDIGNVNISEFPAGNLGQQAMADSLSVVPAIGITDPTYIGDIKFGEELPAGTQLIGKVGIDQVTANANEVVVKTSALPSGAATETTLNGIKADVATIKSDMATEASLSSIDDKLPALTLGQQLSAASLSVAPATDITDATYIGDIRFGEALPAGSAIIGKVGIDQVTANANEVVVKTSALPSGAATETTLNGIKADVATIKSDMATEASLSSIDDKLPALTLGQQLSAASLSVAPATDITDATYIGDIKFGESLPAGSATIGKVGIDSSANNVAVATLPLPTGAATETTLNTAKTDIATIKSDIATIKSDIAAIRAIMES